MSSALLTSMAGMLSCQTMLDVTANNLANSETPGFKGSRTGFRDQMLLTLAGASGASGNMGGTNPMQVGQGDLVASIDVQMTQGAISPTARPLDVSITGPGFFRLQQTDGEEVYSRVGSFGWDSGYQGAPRLVDLSTGYLVLNTQGQAISTVDAMPAAATTALVLSGNLAPADEQPLHGSSLTSLFGLARRDGGQLGGSTRLDDTTLATGTVAAPTTLNVFGTRPDGSSYGGSVVLAAGATVDDLVNGLNGVFSAAVPSFATAQLDGGSLRVSASEPGDGLSVFLGEQAAPALPATDAVANAWQYGGAGDSFAWNRLRLVPSAVSSILPLYTADGTRHELPVRLFSSGITAGSGRTWDLVAGVPEAGSLVPGADSLRGITFASDGTLANLPAGSLSTTWTVGGASTVALQALGLTAFAGDSLLDGVDETGYPAGRLLESTFDQTGRLIGSYSNGRSQAMSATGHQLGLAIFVNPAGLQALGGNLWDVSDNSGDPQLVAPLENGDNSIAGYTLEGSNVDMAGEFSRLIIAQRSFQSNSRSFQVADSLLQEANNLIR